VGKIQGEEKAYLAVLNGGDMMGVRLTKADVKALKNIKLIYLKRPVAIALLKKLKKIR